jgi:hypothetical protein
MTHRKDGDGKSFGHQGYGDQNFLVANLVMTKFLKISDRNVFIVIELTIDFFSLL